MFSGRLFPGRAILLFLCTPLATLPTGAAPNSEVRTLPIAENAFAGSSVNVVANIRSSLFSHGSTQYAAFYDAEGFLVLAKRQLASDTWTTQRTAHRGHVADAHNSISIAIDGAGFLHASWDHHASPLHYARSVAPGSLELAAPTGMTGEQENRVTYPQFHLLPDGDLLFLYRDGASGRGSLILNRYSTASGRWSTVQPSLIDGEGQRSPYWDLCVDSRGTLHLGWVWRDSPDVSSNHDLAYAQSTDGGATWKKSDGAPVKTPITAASAEYAHHIATGSNLMNSPMIAADGDGHPFLCSYWSPSRGAAPQFHIVHHDGSAWQLIAGPLPSQSFSLAGSGTKRPPISRAALLIDPNSRRRTIHLIYRDDARGGRAILATHVGEDAGAWATQELSPQNLGAWEPSIDPVRWQRSAEAHLLVQQVTQRDGDDRTSVAQSSPVASLIWSPVKPGL